MANPSSRQGLIDYALRALGDPVIEINIDENQIEDRVDEGIQYYKGIGHSGAISKVRKTVINSKGHLAVLFKSAHLGILKI